jgi:hypothetical protein
LPENSPVLDTKVTSAQPFDGIDTIRLLALLERSVAQPKFILDSSSMESL